jgi:hypothetical protein
MGGMFIDVFAMFVYKAIIRLFRFVESRRWRKVPAVILDASVEGGIVGCILVKVRYQVSADKQPWPLQDEVPFLSSWDANRYARKLVVNRSVMIRVHPDYTTETTFFESDQK